MSSGVFVHTFALAFRKMSSAIAKAGPSKEAAPVLETPEKDRHKERFEEMMGEIFAGKSGSNSRGEQSLHLIIIFSESLFFSNLILLKRYTKSRSLRENCEDESLSLIHI